MMPEDVNPQHAGRRRDARLLGRRAEALLHEPLLVMARGVPHIGDDEHPSELKQQSRRHQFLARPGRARKYGLDWFAADWRAGVRVDNRSGDAIAPSTRGTAPTARRSDMYRTGYHLLHLVWLARLTTGLTAVGGGAAGTTLRFYNVQETVTAADAAGRPLPKWRQRRRAASRLPPGVHGTRLRGEPRAARVEPHGPASPLVRLRHRDVADVRRAGRRRRAAPARDDVTATLTSTGVSSIPISAGTGKYKNAHGAITVTPTPGGPNADVTIKLVG